MCVHRYTVHLLLWAGGFSEHLLKNIHRSVPVYLLQSEAAVDHVTVLHVIFGANCTRRLDTTTDTSNHINKKHFNRGTNCSLRVNEHPSDKGSTRYTCRGRTAGACGDKEEVFRSSNTAI